MAKRSAEKTAGTGPARLWAPWRAAYVRAGRRGRRPCIFCFGRLSEKTQRARLVLWADSAASVMLNRYPYNNGHLMIAPRRHLASPELLRREERQALAELVALAVKRLGQALLPDGFNVGANIGAVAGAGFAGHFHWHVVPRWEGDTNFMPVVSATKVLSQQLGESFALLAPLFRAPGAGEPPALQ
jgi:ATP adenylyltransferase